MVDTVLSGGWIIDGTRTPPYQADLCIQDGKSVAICPQWEGNCRTRGDVTGKIVSPGFIDIHTHSDTCPFSAVFPESKVAQGITLEIVGNCGVSAVPILPSCQAEQTAYLRKISEIPVPEERTPGSLNILNFNRSHEFRTAVDEALAGHHHEENLKIGTRMYQIIANPVTEKQNVTGAVIVILDITEREEREDLRREFSANVSHELKTPLTSISGYAEIMKNGLVKPEDMKRFSENIYQEAQRMITLIGDIIKLSQLDENRVELEKQAVDLYPIAQSVVSRLKERASQAKVTLEIRGEGQIIEGTSQILDEMIYNLCDNGIKYNKAGGHVNVTVGSRQGCPFVSVEDNGIGIPEEDQKRVFERFYRVDKSHSRQIGGTGLGLSIVKHGAIYHNAKVEMESTPGRGTSITIVFPEGAAK